ncbi:MAG: hypothetical protein LBQ89_01645 [Treponema sp.]|nr:hypothetical protein [Treponema sp.]
MTMLINAGSPKMTTPKIETGARAMSILHIRAVEFTGDAICGLDCNKIQGVDLSAILTPYDFAAAA